MDYLLTVLLALIARQHIFFMLLEMLWWQKPLGRKIFRTDQAFAQQSAALAANQGLYNGFLAAGLIWSVWQPDFARTVFFLGCVIAAGIFGGLSVNRRIFYIQGLPALLTLVLLFLH